ncbi:MAG: ATPase, T2SS/T4P/T4SS family [Bacillota bacterium]|uniref:GspE/PulE family protein n=1 Tax=Desulforudis sp. DRI-14 TaxID=3459793 RepID=UPI003491FC06
MVAVYTKKRLGDLLLQARLITSEQLSQALQSQKQTGERLGKVLINLGLVTEQDILNTLEMQLGIPQVTLMDKVDPDLIKSLPEAVLRRHKVVPIKKEGRRMIVAMSDPLNLVALDDIRLASGCEVEPVLAREEEIDAVLQKVFGLSFVEQAFGQAAGQPEPEIQTLTLGTGDEVPAEEAPVVRLVNTAIVQAVMEKASDIHLEPQEDRVLVRYRVDGLLREALTLPRHIRSSMTTRIKILAGLDIAEKRLPQDGRFQAKYGEQEIDIRVSTLPTVHGEKVVLRLLLKSGRILPVDQLGFHRYNLDRFTEIIRHTSGMILVTGPTGSGKTTTLYAVLAQLNSPERNIITIEDPVEYVLRGINQTQINVKAGLTFAAGLRSILRQDPDIIMIGEIRDGETAQIAVRAATTGHLVLSSLHTNDAAGALTRLIDMGVEPFLVASSVVGVVSQRLVRLLCPRCREPYQLPDDAPERIFMGLAPDEPVTLYRPAGCQYCNNVGYRGRTSIQEVLPVTRTVRELVNRKISADAIKEKAVTEGMVTLKEDGIQKARQGITSISEVMRVAYDEW